MGTCPCLSLSLPSLCPCPSLSLPSLCPCPSFCLPSALPLPLSLLISLSLFALLFLSAPTRDEGKAYVLSHIYLLLGCAMPVFAWTRLIAHTRNALGADAMPPLWDGGVGGWSQVPLSSGVVVVRTPLPRILLLLPHLGWISVGVGDAVVSCSAIYGVSSFTSVCIPLVLFQW